MMAGGPPLNQEPSDHWPGTGYGFTFFRFARMKGFQSVAYKMIIKVFVLLYSNIPPLKIILLNKVVTLLNGNSPC
jgi:hypothetical protein